MPEYVSSLQLAGAAVLTLAGVVWAIVVIRLLRRFRAAALRELPAAHLPFLPPQRQAGPALEKVELTPAEQDAFAGLIRRLGDH
ncbi:hypothetical protein ACFYZB_06180 [Streptomyces sp. NPDC001852]|uniref:hypothetical protein n=1 Tax=Streptomyces sp. NPDC001852 TaxID=3364619 RepID=UPI003694BCEA